jgi:hypothetical protein
VVNPPLKKGGGGGREGKGEGREGQAEGDMKEGGGMEGGRWEREG